MTKEYPDIQLLKRYRPISNSLPMIELLPSPDVIKNMISILKIGYLGADWHRSVPHIKQICKLLSVRIGFDPSSSYDVFFTCKCFVVIL